MSLLLIVCKGMLQYSLDIFLPKSCHFSLIFLFSRSFVSLFSVGISISQFGFRNKTRNPFSDFDRQKSFFQTDFVEQWEIEIRISQ